MSHFDVLVITEKEPTDDVLEQVLMPYHEYECTGIEEYVVDVDVTDKLKEDFEKYKKPGDVFNAIWAKEWSGAEKKGQRYFTRTNPNAKWDWWVRGGRYMGMLKPKSSAETISGRPGTFGNDAMYKDGVDSCQLGSIALKEMQDESEAEAAAAYDKFTSIVAGRSFKTWDQVKDENPDIEVARAKYHAQLVIKDLTDAQAIGFFDGPEPFMVPREEYLKKARNRVLQTFAIVKDGKWYKRGEMGWWGVVHDEKDGSAWDAEFTKLLEGLPSETWLTVVDCHI